MGERFSGRQFACAAISFKKPSMSLEECRGRRVAGRGRNKTRLAGQSIVAGLTRTASAGSIPVNAGFGAEPIEILFEFMPLH
jgi:hypothetical protein